MPAECISTWLAEIFARTQLHCDAVASVFLGGSIRPNKGIDFLREVTLTSIFVGLPFALAVLAKICPQILQYGREFPPVVCVVFEVFRERVIFRD